MPGLKWILGFVFSGVLALAPGAAVASESAWVLKKNSTYIEVEPSYFTFSNDVRSRVHAYAFNNRVEIGILDTSSVFFSLPFQTLSRFDTLDTETQVFTNNGLTDVHLGNIFQFMADPVALSLKTALKIPMGYNDNEDVLLVPSALPTLGNQQLDLEAQLLSGYQFPWFPGYIQGGLGYRFRSNFDPQHVIVQSAALNNITLVKPADQIVGQMEVGVWLLSKLFLSLAFQGEWGLNQTEAQIQSLVTLRPLLAYRLTPYVDISLQYEQALWGQNQPLLTGFRLGSHYRFGLPLPKPLGIRGGKAEHATKDPNI